MAWVRGAWLPVQRRCLHRAGAATGGARGSARANAQEPSVTGWGCIRNKLPLQHKLHGRRTALKACSSQAKLTWHHLDVDDTGGAPHGAGAGAAAANVHRAALPPQAAYQDRQQGQDAEYGQEGDARFGACLGYMWEGYGK